MSLGLAWSHWESLCLSLSMSWSHMVPYGLTSSHVVSLEVCIGQQENKQPPKVFAQNKQGKFVEVQFTCQNCNFHIFNPKLTSCPTCKAPKPQGGKAESVVPSPSFLPPKCHSSSWEKEMSKRGAGEVVKIIQGLFPEGESKPEMASTGQDTEGDVTMDGGSHDEAKE